MDFWRDRGEFVSGAIAIYVEGGGDQKDTRIRLRNAFNAFLKDLRERARRKKIHWKVRPCGGRNSTVDNFKTALRADPDAFNVLLVDSEGPVTSQSPWSHLKSQSGKNWQNLGLDDKHCHLMVQMMEAWLIADRDKLKEYYGKGFRETALPPNRNVEQLSKGILLDALNQVARDTRKKRYEKCKSRDGPGILEKIRSDKVRSRATYCDRLFTTILDEIDAT